MVQAALKERQWWQELAAWVVMHLCNASGNFKQPVTMDQLLGPAWTIDRLTRAKAAADKAP